MSRPSPLPGYSTREVARLLDLSPDQVRRQVRWGLLAPRRGPRNEMLFSFQDLVVLKAAQGLLDARIPARRVRRALDRLRDQLPSGRPLTAVRIAAEGSQIVVRTDSEAWEPLSGQRVLDFEVAELAQRAEPLALGAIEDAHERSDDLAAEDWYQLGFELEATATREAEAAYIRALELEPGHPDAHLNLGRLLHEKGRIAAAESHYRAALTKRPRDATAAFNLGVALQDLDRKQDAAEAYRHALSCDPEYTDAHFNLARIYEQLGNEAEAIRTLKVYRNLSDRE